MNKISSIILPVSQDWDADSDSTCLLVHINLKSLMMLQPYQKLMRQFVTISKLLWALIQVKYNQLIIQIRNEKNIVQVKSLNKILHVYVCLEYVVKMLIKDN